MVNLDLRKLSAPVEALRPQLTDAYGRLDAQWAEIAKCLKSLPIPTSISHSYSCDEFHPEHFECLVWKKWNGKQRICHEYHHFHGGQNPYSNSDYDVTTTPYEEWSGQRRIDLLEHVPGLFEAAEKQTKEFIDKTKN